MRLRFYKYQGTGNDFVVIDNRNQSIDLNTQQIAFLCDRRIGIGADGFMMLQHKEGYDFEMRYYNADGNIGSMCGNGARCMVAFAASLGIFSDHTHFLAADGAHEAKLLANGEVSLKMCDVSSIECHKDHCILNTGSPHYVAFREDIENMDVVHEGRNIRYNELFAEKGINVNFVENKTNNLKVRTYERGVENETLSCGTGVTAVALAHATDAGKYNLPVFTRGGTLHVAFTKTTEDRYTDIWLTGAATMVFKGEIDL